MSNKRVLWIMLLIVATVALMGLAACRFAEGDVNAAPLPQTESVSNEAASQGYPVALESEVTTAVAPSQNSPTTVPIEVQDVQVEIGIGSPIPVYIQVAGTWPGLCAQLAAVEQQIDAGRFDITLLADLGDPDCPPDFLGLPFSLALPINIVELPEGSYTVTVNGISASFEVSATPFGH
jgi:hypothetical protein